MYLFYRWDHIWRLHRAHWQLGTSAENSVNTPDTTIILGRDSLGISVCIIHFQC